MSNTNGRQHSRRLAVEIWFQSLFALRVFVELHAGSIRTTLQKGGGNRTRKPFYVTPLQVNNLRNAKNPWQRFDCQSAALAIIDIQEAEELLLLKPLGRNWTLSRDVRFCK